jgi:hypothetical protein
MLLLLYGHLCSGLPSYKADLDLSEGFATSVAASHPGDDGEASDESDIDSLYSELNRRLETQLKQFERNNRPDSSLEGKVNIPTSGKSDGMEDRKQGSNLTWNDNVLDSIIHQQVILAILLVLLFICIAAAICCGCRCVAFSCSSICGFYRPRIRNNNSKKCVATNPPKDLDEDGRVTRHETTININEA